MISVYKPNQKNEGCACSFYLGKDQNVYINLIKQYSWDAKARTGSFSENRKNKDKSISIKINEFEIGGIIKAIESFSNFSAFHSYEENKTSISLSTWKKPDNTGAFGLSVTRNSVDKFKLPIELGEAETIKFFLIFCLNKKFLNNEKKKDLNTQ